MIPIPHPSHVFRRLQKCRNDAGCLLLRDNTLLEVKYDIPPYFIESIDWLRVQRGYIGFVFATPSVEHRGDQGVF